MITNSVICANCATPVDDNDNFCKKCGSPIKRILSEKSSNVFFDDHSQIVCVSPTDAIVGSVLAETLLTDETKEYSSNITVLLCLTLGFYGAHDFYCSNIRNAIIKLVIGLTGVGLIATIPWAFIDLLHIWRGSYLDGNGNKLKGKPLILYFMVILLGFLCFLGYLILKLYTYYLRTIQ
jgi:TM2 domain-containing membrane protein YozV